MRKGTAWCGEARPDAVKLGMAGAARQDPVRRGAAGYGVVRPGTARFGKLIQLTILDAGFER
jgi:hypothetical protein